MSKAGRPKKIQTLLKNDKEIFLCSTYNSEDKDITLQIFAGLIKFNIKEFKIFADFINT